MKICTAVLLALASIPALAQQVPGTFTPMQPCRLFDSRFPSGSPTLVAGTTIQIAVRRTTEELEGGACGVPIEANSVFLAATVVGATGEGYVRIWASDLALPVTSTLTFRGNGVDSSLAVSRLCAPPLLECSGVDLSIRPEINNTHLILDLVGYTLPIDEPELEEVEQGEVSGSFLACPSGGSPCVRDLVLTSGVTITCSEPWLAAEACSDYGAGDCVQVTGHVRQFSAAPYVFAHSARACPGA